MVIFTYHQGLTFKIVFMCFVWISEQTAIISLYSINWLVFITETESVYSAVRAGYLNFFVVVCVLKGLRLLFSAHVTGIFSGP